MSKLLLVRYCNLMCVLCGVFFFFFFLNLLLHHLSYGTFHNTNKLQIFKFHSIWTFKRLLNAFLGTAVLGRSINKLHCLNKTEEPLNLLGIDPVKIDYSLLIWLTTSAMFQPVPYHMKPKLTHLHFLTAHL